MDYEQKYKEALETVQEILSSGADAIRIKTLKLRLQSVFPELAESKDERIRKELIEHIKANKEADYVLFKKFSPDDVIAWLEKQGANKEYVFRPLAGTTIEKAVEQAVELDGKVVLAFNGVYIPVGNKTKDEIIAQYHNWLEKQGKKLDADKVIDWLKTKVYDDSTYGMAMIEKFKKDFGL